MDISKRSMGLKAAAFAMLVSLGCAHESPPSSASIARYEGQSCLDFKFAQGEDKRQVITTKPLTVEIQAEQELQKSILDAMDAYPNRMVRLTILDVKPSAHSDVIGGVLIFLNKPDASARTSAKDPHFVAAFSFEPSNKKTQSFQFDMTKTLLKLRQAGELNLRKALQVTLVLVPLGSSELPEDVSVPVRDIKIVPITPSSGSK